MTINENIADAGGVRIAFNAFRTLAKAENITATGKYTLEQLFFIGYGTVSIKQKKLLIFVINQFYLSFFSVYKNYYYYFIYARTLNYLVTVIIL